MTRTLHPDAQADRDDFVRAYGTDGNCSCHLSPPCGSCTHPGNPRNQEEDDNCWLEGEGRIGESCGYQGRHFGAWYDDGGCIDGYLWDLDSCDAPGGWLTSGGDIPCPCCNTREYVADFPLGGNAKQRRKGRRALMRKVWEWAGREPFAGGKKGGAA